MKEKTVNIKFDSATGQWTASENPVAVTPGLTAIVWTIGLASDSQGEIHFGTEADFPGIQFTKGWPGTRPHGDKKVWMTAIEDKMQPDDPPQLFHYTVNAWYADRREEIQPEKKSWDPDVEEESDPSPPPV